MKQGVWTSVPKNEEPFEDMLIEVGPCLFWYPAGGALYRRTAFGWDRLEEGPWE